MTTIELRRCGGYWVADHHGAGARDILILFGTTTLPTPFQACQPAHVVLAAIRQRNPDARVHVLDVVRKARRENEVI